MSHALHCLSVCYYYGDGGLQRSKSEAVELDAAAAMLGNANAQYSLGVCFDNGEGGLYEDEGRASQLYRVGGSPISPFF